MRGTTQDSKNGNDLYLARADSDLFPLPNLPGTARVKKCCCHAYIVTSLSYVTLIADTQSINQATRSPSLYWRLGKCPVPWEIILWKK